MKNYFFLKIFVFENSVEFILCYEFATNYLVKFFRDESV